MKSAELECLCGDLLLGGYEGEAPTAKFLQRLARGQVGGAILFRRNLPSVEAGCEAARALLEAARSGAPPWIAVDQEGGRVRRLGTPVLQLPSMRALAFPNDADLVQRAGRVLGAQLRGLGFNVDFAPVLDVDTNPANPVIGDRSFGRDPETVSRLGVAFTRGLQAAGVVACGKHFPGHGDTSVDSHLELPRVDATRERLNAVELAPFRAAIAAGLQAIMSAHIVCPALAPDLPGTLAPEVITALLRKELGFEGVVFSDDLEMKAIAGRWSIGGAAVAAVRAGCDVVCICKEEAWQQQAHQALVQECERDADFLRQCARASARSRALRNTCPPSPAADIRLALAPCHSPEALALADEITLRCRLPPS